MNQNRLPMGIEYLCKLNWQWVFATVLLALLCVPLVLSPAPLSVDLNNHLVRYVAIADHFGSNRLSSSYTFLPGVFPNLGMDILGTTVVLVAGPDVGTRIASALVLISVPLGYLILTRCINEEIRPIDYPFAALLGYSHIFVWGFANFLLGAGVAMALLGLWVALEKSSLKQFAVGAAGGMLLIVIHALAFGIWGIVLFAFEVGRWACGSSRCFRDLVWRTGRLIAIAVIPTIYFFLSKTADAPQSALFFAENLRKYSTFESFTSRILEEICSRLYLLLAVPDSGMWPVNVLVGSSVVMVVLVCLLKGYVQVDRRLLSPIVALVLLWALIPPNIYGSGYANDRIPLLVWSVVFASLRWSGIEAGKQVSALSFISTIAFVHVTVVYIVYALAASSYNLYLRELPLGRSSQVAVTLMYSGADRFGLQPYCSAFEFLSFIRGGYSVQTFEYASQQPIRMSGRLKELVDRRRGVYSNESVRLIAGFGASASLQGAIEDHLDLGYGVVTVCGAVHRSADLPAYKMTSSGFLWSIYAR